MPQPHRRGRTSRRRRRLRHDDKQERVDRSILQLLRTAGRRIVRRNVKTCRVSGSGQGLVARRAMRQGEAICSVESDLILFSHPVPLTTSLDSCSKPFKELIEQLMLKCHSTAELVAYVASLPHDYPNLVYQLDVDDGDADEWRRDMFQCLPSDLVESLTEQRAAFYRCGIGRSASDWEQFRRCYFAVNTRCIYYSLSTTGEGGHGVAMVPFVDLVNHTDQVPNAFLEWQPVVGSQRLRAVVRAVRPIQRHEEITFNYGEHDNDDLFVEYGFVVKGNRHDRLAIAMRPNAMGNIYAPITLHYYATWALCALCNALDQARDKDDATTTQSNGDELSQCSTENRATAKRFLLAQCLAESDRLQLLFNLQESAPSRRLARVADSLQSLQGGRLRLLAHNINLLVTCGDDDSTTP